MACHNPSKKSEHEGHLLSWHKAVPSATTRECNYFSVVIVLATQIKTLYLMLLATLLYCFFEFACFTFALAPLPIRTTSLVRVSRWISGCQLQHHPSDDVVDNLANEEDSFRFYDVVDMDEDESDMDWLPDREKALRAQQETRIYAEKIKSSAPTSASPISSTITAEEELDSTSTFNRRASAYTEEEEDVIAAMGGKTLHAQRKREEGYLGDSTLKEIAMDYSVPVCYLADVLCMWGVPVPINIDDRLGDLVTGEQAFAILEAVHSLDVGALNDRYSNTNLMNLCYNWDIDLQAAFEMAMKEGWSLPFGVQTCLRVEQEEELLRVLASL